MFLHRRKTYLDSAVKLEIFIVDCVGVCHWCDGISKTIGHVYILERLSTPDVVWIVKKSQASYGQSGVGIHSATAS